MARAEKHFICRVCQNRVTVFVSDAEEWEGGVSAECANKHKRSVMVELDENEEE